MELIIKIKASDASIARLKSHDVEDKIKHLVMEYLDFFGDAHVEMTEQGTTKKPAKRKK